MTDPKKPAARPPTKAEPAKAAAGRPAAADPGAGREPSDDATKSRDDLLRQLVRLTDAVEKLANRTPPPTEPPTPPPPTTPPITSTPPDPVVDERRKVLFAYDYLGEVLNRRNFRFNPRAEVDRDDVGLTFRNLGEVVASVRLRSADNTVEPLSGITNNVRVELQKIPDDQPIDAFLVLDPQGVPVAIADCEPAIEGVDVE